MKGRLPERTLLEWMQGRVVAEQTVDEAICLLRSVPTETERVLFGEAGPRWVCWDAAEEGEVGLEV